MGMAGVEVKTLSMRFGHLTVSAGLLATLAACGVDRTPPESGTGGSRHRDDPAGAAGSAGATLAEPIEYVGLNGLARNPIVSHVFTADPSAHVFEDRIYVYASHDLDDQSGYDMHDYHVFSSNDLVNWQDHGVALDAADIPWTSRLYAPDCCHHAATGQYYLYFPNNGSSIGVAVSDDPGGPFTEAIGRSLVNRSTPGVEDVDWVFDPSCFIDDDGQAYLYFGGGMPDTGDNARVIRLGEDMVSLADDVATTIPAPDFFEAPFMHKYDGRYYFSYSTTFADHSAHIDYLVGDDPMTGLEYVGTILENPSGNNSDNNHHSIVEYEGGWYIFYHNRILANRDGYSNYQRSITLDHLAYATDGSIEPVPTSRGEITQLRNLDAFSRLEAETLADQRGIEVEFAEEDGTRVGVSVTHIHNGDWIGYSRVDFGDGATRFKARVASDSATGGSIDIYLDGCDRFANLPGELVGSCNVDATGGWQDWTDVECAIEETTDVHDVYLRFSGPTPGSLFNFDHFQFD
jgi:arabinoxylan arabinofuranohydrolase